MISFGKFVLDYAEHHRVKSKCYHKPIYIYYRSKSVPMKFLKLRRRYKNIRRFI